ncbi:MAG: hypothetical protein Q3M24_13530 [Candidatus Electrothrix aestuarii]|uniref:Uncharacterized protein n=1 Tax=Candidatus Electrothrix aestuarii TaxID=3062594 RepID=A0AAU8LQN3_9BACT|nr:hypothetical protein [Candidatus Electrothrix aestuarii]
MGQSEKSKKVDGAGFGNELAESCPFLYTPAVLLYVIRDIARLNEPGDILSFYPAEKKSLWMPN